MKFAGPIARKGLVVAAMAALVACGSPESTALQADVSEPNVGVKWHPGHYYQPMSADLSADSYVMRDAYDEMYATPAIRGIQLRLEWADLEVEKDKYDFSIIDGHLEKLVTTGDKSRRLFVLIHTKTFDTTTKLVPDYITNPTDPSYEGGTYPFGNEINGSDPTKQKGSGIRLWNANVRDRMGKLMTALGNRYNSHSHFEGLILGETAMGQPLKPITPAMEVAYYDAHLYLHTRLRAAFPNTITIQFTNFPRNILNSFVAKMEETGMSLGGPDILLDDPGLNAIGTKYTTDGIYRFYPKLSGEIALAPSIMSSNYIRTTATGSPPSRKPSIRELLDFGRNNLKANYLFWTRDPAFYREVLTTLNTLSNDHDSAVELNNACPGKFALCNRD